MSELAKPLPWPARAKRALQRERDDGSWPEAGLSPLAVAHAWRAVVRHIGPTARARFAVCLGQAIGPGHLIVLVKRAAERSRGGPRNDLHHAMGSLLSAFDSFKEG